MLEESSRLGEIFALVAAGLGVTIILYSIAFRRSILVMAIGAVIAAAALVAPMLIRLPPVSVVVVRGDGDQVSVERTDSFYDGTYTTGEGQRIEIRRNRTWGRAATVVINDSDRLATLIGYAYSRFKYADGGPEPLSFVMPGHMRVFPRRIDGVMPAGEKPPDLGRVSRHSRIPGQAL
jgi:hypothetical protein